MILTTKRLQLRPWEEDDAESLYQYAKDPKVGPIATWPVHTDVENSRQVIIQILSVEETYAVVLKGEKNPIGSAGILIGEKSSLNLPSTEGEVGYWLGVPYWGKGIMPEAVQELLRHGFEELGLTKLWCGHLDKNNNSKRVMEKCGFRYHHTEKDKEFPLIQAIETEHIRCITKEQWLKQCWIN